MQPFTKASPATRESASPRPSPENHTPRNESSIAPLLLTRSQIAVALNVSEGNARKMLEAHGVLPINLGRGRGNGLRWLTSAVIKVADILHAEAQAKSAKKCRRIPAHTLVGKTAAQLFAEFNGKSRRNAEVCNGN